MARTLFRLLNEATTAAAAAGNSSSETATTAVDSDLVVILAALLCALICVLGLIAVSRCLWIRRVPAGIARITGGGSAGGQSQSTAAANKGVKKKVIRSLPTVTYSPESPPAATKLSAECAICLAEFAAGDELRVLPQCGHVFHVSCIDTWLGSHSSCPSCRQILVVARCQKCGGFSGKSNSGSGSEPVPVPVPDTRFKESEHNHPIGFLP